MKKIFSNKILNIFLIFSLMFINHSFAQDCSELIVTFVERGTGTAADGSAGNVAESFTICYNVHTTATCPTLDCSGEPTTIDIDGVTIMDNVTIRHTITNASATSTGGPGTTMIAAGGCLTFTGPWYPDGTTASNTAQFNSGSDCANIGSAPASVDLVSSINCGSTDTDCTSSITGVDGAGNSCSLASQLTCPTPACSAPTGAPMITESVCGTGCTPAGGVIAIGDLACADGALNYSIDNGVNWLATLPTYDQTTAVDVLVSCDCDNTLTTGPFTTVPGTCTDPVAPTGGSITDSACSVGCGTPSGGTITAPTCATGTLNWSETLGGPYTTAAVTYDQEGPAQTIYTVCIDANGCESPEYNLGTTAPGTCTNPAAPTGGSITESTCTVAGGTPSGGAITAPTCATGTLNWSETSGGPYTTTAVTYAQAGPAQMIYTVCIDANGCESTETVLGPTVPGTCPSPVPNIAITDPCDCINGIDTNSDGQNDILEEEITIYAAAGQTITLATPGGLVTTDGTTAASGTATDNADGTYTYIAYVPASTAYTATFTVSGGGVNDGTTPMISGGNCTPCAIADCPACDCSMAPNSYTINTSANTSTTTDYTVVYVLSDGTTPNTTGTFTGLLGDGTIYNVYAFSVLNTDLMAFQNAITNMADVTNAISGTAPFDSFCYAANATPETFMQDCECTSCPDFEAVGNEAPPVIIDSEAGCDTSTDPFTTTVGVTSDVTGTCPTGSTLEYSFDGGPWVATFMDAYDQTTSVEIRTRCVCEDDTDIVGPETIVVTNPQEGCPVEVCPSCDCSATSGDYYTINTIAIGQTGYTTVYILVDNDNGDVVLQNNQTGMFTAVPDDVDYTVYAYNVLDAEVTAFEGAIPANIAEVADAIGTFCAAGAAETFSQDCDCCPDIAATMMGEGQICNSGTADISVEITGGVGPYDVTYSDGANDTMLMSYTSGAAITLMPTATTTYGLVMVTDANGCAATINGTATITVTMSCAEAGGFNRN